MKTSNEEEEVKVEIPSSPENLEHSINSDNDETNEEHRELIIILLRETYSKNIKARIQLFAGKRWTKFQWCVGTGINGSDLSSHG